MYPVKKTITSIGKCRLFPLIIASAILAFFLVAVLITGITWLTTNLVSFEKQWLDQLVNWTIGILTGIGGWFILPVFTVLVAGVFQETTIQRVEQTFYKNKLRKNEPQLWPDILHDIKFTTKALLLNILILPLYFVGIGLLCSIMLNSYLLGREFFESAAGHHLGKPAARKLGSMHKKAIYGGGFFITLMTLTPILNLFAPILAIVWMVHVYHSPAINNSLNS